MARAAIQRIESAPEAEMTQLPESEYDSDIQLMLQTKNGDPAAFSELFERYAKRLVGFAYGIIHNRWRAEELVQDAFLQIYRARDRYYPKARFSTYLYRVVTNNCLNEIRRRDHEKSVPEDSRPLAADTAPGPEHLVMDREIVTKVGKVLFEELPAKQRAALLLSRVDGLDHREVATCLGVSEYSVKSLVFRATRTLRDHLQQDGGKRAARPRSKRRVAGAQKRCDVSLGRVGAAWLRASEGQLRAGELAVEG